MKSKWLLAGCVLLFFAVQTASAEGLVDGSFAGSGWFRFSTTGKLATGDLDNGWVVYQTGGLNAFTWAGNGSVTRQAGNVTGTRGFAQILTSALTGTKDVSVTWSQDDVATANRVYINIYGFSDLAAAANTSISASTAPVDGTVLGSFSTTGGDYSGTTVISTDFGSGYSYIVVRVVTDLDTGSVVTVSDVSFPGSTPPPQPGTVVIIK